MTSKKLLCGSLLSGLLVALPIPSSADGATVVLADQVTPVHLCGSLKRETHWGPPGFGETPKLDVRRLIWIVNLYRPAVFHYKGDNGKDVEETLKIVQISLRSGSFDHQLHQMLGRSVVLTGSIWSASSEGDITPVVIEMTSIASLGKSTECTN